MNLGIWVRRVALRSIDHCGQRREAWTTCFAGEATCSVSAPLLRKPPRPETVPASQLKIRAMIGSPA